ncbi:MULTISPECIES: HK97-gp10 family putative phage morphogenesis protein [Kosakonia]|uniref:HK97-gp10 family putative phage morphogenesis protein n=1 Tax=Kosakonia TaxID=1330547 RepID=UPI0005F07B15|nr:MULTISPECIES: HK97-gp10 family putative phage morphogenesis protein [Kosakonia]RCX01889.1 HK97 gp10 family phage protein [Kosakonia sp. AG348]
MIDTNLDFSDLLDLSKDLEALSKAENRKVMRDATRAAATVFKDEAVNRAPERTGKLKKNIVVITQRDRNGDISSGVHVRGTNPHTGNSDNSMKASNSRNAFYWRFVELGTSNMAAVPFIRPAYDARQEDAANAAFVRANQAIDEALSK